MRIGIVAGELSGDQLGAGLIRALRARYPHATFEGVGGPKMIAEGFTSHYPIDRLAVMGLVEPLKRLPELLSMRRWLKRHFLAVRPDVFIGIDSPDFNLGLEFGLRRHGIKTVHYVSPSVWAWRQGRIRKIARAVDLMLTLLPFEADFYHQHRVPVAFVGHPLAAQLPMEPDTAGARAALSLAADDRVLAVLPGSRSGEVAQLAPCFLQTVRRCREVIPGLKVVIPAASRARRDQLEALLQQEGLADIQLLDGQSLLAMTAADAVLLTSGTVALEAMLLKKPMVVAYRMGAASYWLLSRMVKTPFISLPNLLAGTAVVPELLQDEVTVDRLVAELQPLLTDDQAHLRGEFKRLHQLVMGPDAGGASEAGAVAIEHLLTAGEGEAGKYCSGGGRADEEQPS